MRPTSRSIAMIEAAFDTAQKLFGLTFEERHDMPV